MTLAPRRAVLWAAALLVALAAADVDARGGGRGGGARAAGARAGGGGFQRGGAAANGSWGQNRAAGNVQRGAYRRQGPAASGTFAGRSSGGYAGGGYEGGFAGGDGGARAESRRVEREAVAQQQRARFGRLGPAEGPRDAGERRDDRQEARTERRDDRQDGHDDRRDDWQSYDQARREDWQDYAHDHDDEHVHGYYGAPYYAYSTGVAAVAVPEDWTLPCTPNVVVVGATTYYQCGSAWYIRAYSGGEVIYTMANPPVGY